MSKQEVTIVLAKRDVVGKGLGKLKRDGIIPAVIHQPGSESISVEANFADVTKAYGTAGKQQPVTVTLDNKELLTMIKDVDFEPTKHRIRHVVFGVIKQNETVETEVPVEIEGVSAAEKAGLTVIHHTNSVTIEALPRNLIDALVVNIEGLTNVGDKITIADVKPPTGVTILTDPETPLAVVEEIQELQVEPEESTETVLAEEETTAE